MKMLKRIQPTGAVTDLRDYLGRRRPHQWVFATLAVMLTLLTIWMFWWDTSGFKKAYHRDIIYVQQWRADRTDAEIIAQQRIDGPIQARREAEEQRRQLENRRKFQRIENNLQRWGFGSPTSRQ